LYTGMFYTTQIDDALNQLRIYGSKAAPGFMKPEGVVIYHTAGNVYFKKTIVGDDQPKSINQTQEQK